MGVQRFLIIDDEMNSAMDLQEVLAVVEPDAEAEIRTEAADALEYLQGMKGKLRCIFLDIQLRGILGIDLYHQLKEIDPDVPIVFVTAYDHYAIEGWKIHAAGYLLKPADPSDIESILSHIEKNYEHEERKEEKTFIAKCFGNFDVFFKGRALVFKRNRSKEVLAFLIDKNGQFVSGEEICDALWEDSYEDKKNKNYLRQLIFDVQRVLTECGAEEALIHRRNQYAIDVNYFDCDYFRYMEGSPEAKNLFQGEYMNQYSWAEVRLGYLIFSQEE